MKDCYGTVSEIVKMLEKECFSSGLFCTDKDCPLYERRQDYLKERKKQDRHRWEE